jgi:hypothetical protein
MMNHKQVGARSPDRIPSGRRMPAPAPAPASASARPAPATAANYSGAWRCSCGGGCPRCSEPAPAPDSASAPLGAEDRSFLEARFGQDFSAVRLHRDEPAARAAAGVGARAFTVGHDIVLGAHEHRPGSPGYRRLLAHELAHVVQQQGTGADTPGPPPTGVPGDRFEREADAVAQTAMAGATAGPIKIRQHTSTPMVQRQPVTASPPAAAPTDSEITLPDGTRLSGQGLENLLLNTPLIAPHVSTRIAKGQSAAGHTHFLYEGEFETRFVNYAVPKGGTPKPNPLQPGTNFDPASAHDFANKVSGFVDRDTNELFVKRIDDTRKGPASMLPTSIHEAVHFYANPSLIEVFGFNASEGLTDFFTVEVCAANGIDPMDLAYDAQAGAVRAIVDRGYLTIQEMAEWYFGRDYLLFERKHPDVAVDWTRAMKAGNWSMAKRALRSGTP